jgi:hypothetical protein
MLAGKAWAQQVPIPQTAAQVSGPIPGTVMTKDYIQMVGRAAYFWGYPLVNTSNRRARLPRHPSASFSAAPYHHRGSVRNESGILLDLPRLPQGVVANPNADLPMNGGSSDQAKE